MESINPQIESSWKTVLSGEFREEYFSHLKQFLIGEKQRYVIFPPGPDIFSAFNHTPFGSVRCVILGQDPYHGKGQAHGLCFSVNPGIRQPPSLQNIFRELQSDLGFDPPVSGSLVKWTQQGVLLLNAILTVREGQPCSHENKGWERFTDSVISTLSSLRENLVFMLWGNYAQSKARLIDSEKHLIIRSAHPSPYSASSGFFGSRPFSRANEYLKDHQLGEIDWRL